MPLDESDLEFLELSLARRAGDYRAALLKNGIPPDLADAMTYDWQRAIVYQSTEMPPIYPPYQQAQRDDERPATEETLNRVLGALRSQSRPLT